MGWYDSTSDDEPARVKETGDRVETLFGGDNPRGDGSNHGHMVSNDGLNADYLRMPNGEVVVDNRLDNPYGS